MDDFKPSYLTIVCVFVKNPSRFIILQSTQLKGKYLEIYVIYNCTDIYALVVPQIKKTYVLLLYRHQNLNKCNS